mmetsp:Transcript_32781/g.94137  ORF Transcript_32781/g.94137 Transcript_32781/m.94137 type:complete len:229 (-) Transcript_32781:247-933(-)
MWHHSGEGSDPECRSEAETPDDFSPHSDTLDYEYIGIYAPHPMFSSDLCDDVGISHSSYISALRTGSYPSVRAELPAPASSPAGRRASADALATVRKQQDEAPQQRIAAKSTSASRSLPATAMATSSLDELGTAEDPPDPFWDLSGPGVQFDLFVQPFDGYEQVLVPQLDVLVADGEQFLSWMELIAMPSQQWKQQSKALHANMKQWAQVLRRALRSDRCTVHWPPES